jgi:uncharacterized membrane protein (DUF2068 family)
MSYPADRPRTIAVVAGFLFAATVIAVTVGVSLLFPNPVMDRLWRLNPAGAVAFHAVGRISGFFLLALGVGTFVSAWGLVRGRKWAWWFSVSLFALNAAGDLVSFFATHEALRSISGMVISFVFIYCLTRPPVRRYFHL